ncbi:MAG: DUF916 and DUF3324 domain-containing protein [Enterococcus lacertideformus]|uniref:DUF916 and DUF3324 domain-containing protein n=1 Tax=Enterococcus lacertideformus TaxID=2771493 RepID=A0A931F8Y0_9ENTE|nr:DUF916 and DUF3324 domain-containing protein [Enterococcus lacertideformus]
MTKKNKKVLLLLVFFSGFFLWNSNFKSLIVKAETTAFTVLPSFPENQVSDATYFDLHVKEETEQILMIVVQNTTDQALIIEATALNSYTTSTGIIAYQIAKTAEKNQGHSFTEFIEPKKQQIKLKPNEAKEVLFTLKLNKQNIIGEILGAFSFELLSPKAKTAQKESMIQTRYVTQLGIRLRSELTELPSPNLTLIKTEPIVKNSYAAIQSTIKNDQPVAFGNIRVHTTIYNKKTKKNVGEKKAENYQFAPNSTLPLITDLASEQLETGDYTTHIELTSSKGNWNFDDSFTVTKTSAKSINQKTVYAQKDKNNWLIYLLLLFITLLLAIILFLGWRYYQVKKSQRK